MNDAMGAPVPLLAQAPRGRPLLGLAETRRPIVVVLGPQHSGTAVCAYALNLLGVDITEIEPAADPHERNASPDREIWERQPIRQFHDRIFELFDRDAAGPLYDFALPVAWWADPRLVPVRRDIVGFLEDRVTAGNFGFADARTVRLLPLWQQIFAELKLQAKFVLCLRNPGAAAGTARLREGLAPEIAEYRWFLHMADFFRYAGKVEHCAIEYERWREEPSANFDRLQDFLGFDWLHGAAEREMALAGIAGLADGAEPGGSPEPHQPMVRSFYRLARGGAQPGSAGPREQIVQQFVAFQQLQKPIEKALAAQAAAAGQAAGERDSLAADCAALGAELATARALLAERDAALAQTRAQLHVSSQGLAERDEALQSLAARLREAEALAAETNVQREELETACRAGDARAETLRGSLAQTEAARDTLQALVGAIRQELAEARDAGNQQAASLREQLAAARQVGQAAMRALALTAVPAPPAVRLGWLTMIRRRLGFIAR
jgi:hypothetical protein